MPYKKLIICILILNISLVGTIFSQNGDVNQKRIVEVKANYTNYIFVEEFSSKKENAIKQAMSKITALIQNDSHYNVAEKTDLLKHLDTITMKFGNTYRAFVFVRKPQKDIVDPTPPTVPEPIPTPPQDTLPAPPLPPPPPEEKDTVLPPSSSDIISDILSIATPSELERYIRDQYENGTILDYGELNQLNHPELYYIIVYDRQEKRIETILSPGRSERTNLKTHDADRLENYQNYHCIGFLIPKRTTKH